MLDLNDFRCFVEVANRGAFNLAAEALGMPTSTVSYRIQQLEKHFGTTLFTRARRKVTLTRSGNVLYEHANATLQHAAAAEAAMQRRRETTSGTVRYTASIAVSTFTMPAIVSRFLEAYPHVKVASEPLNRQVDVVAEGFDLAIRAHSTDLPSSGLIQRRLADVPWHLFAAPAYLATRGAPETPGDLAEHVTLFIERSSATPKWRFVDAHAPRAKPVVVRLRPRMHSASMVTLKKAAFDGLGIVALPACTCREELAAGTLARVLPRWPLVPSRLTAVMPSGQKPSAATRAFLEHLVAELPAAVS